MTLASLGERQRSTDAGGGVIEDLEVDALYRLGPDDFVAARDSLAKALRSTGDREAAAQVKALRRPSVGAWLVNQLAREHADDLDELLATGEALRATQTAVLAGRADGTQLQALTATRRQQIDALVGAARTVAQNADRKSAPLDAVDATLVAATADAAAAAAVRSGRLVKELSYSGFGMADDLEDAVAPTLRVVRKTTPKAPVRASATRVVEPPPAAKKRGDTAHRTTAADPAAARRAEAVKTATAAAADAQQAVNEASGRADDAQRALESVTRELDRAVTEEKRLVAELAAARELQSVLKERQRDARGTARAAHLDAERARTQLVKAQQKLDHLP